MDIFHVREYGAETDPESVAWMCYSRTFARAANAIISDIEQEFESMKEYEEGWKDSNPTMFDPSGLMWRPSNDQIDNTGVNCRSWWAHHPELERSWEIVKLFELEAQS